MRTAKAAKTKAEIKATITGKIKKVIAASIVAVTLATSISLSPVANTAITVEAKASEQGHTKKVTMKPFIWSGEELDPSYTGKLDVVIKACGINGNMTEYEAVDRLNDWIAKNIKYDYDHSSQKYAISVITTLKYKEGVCEDYAMLFQALCDRIGIKSVIVGSDTHAWNLVQVDRVWYHIDTCWNACWVNADPKKWFLLSESEILKDHEPIEDIGRDNQDEVYKGFDKKSVESYFVDYYYTNTKYTIKYNLKGGKNNKSNPKTYYVTGSKGNGYGMYSKAYREGKNLDNFKFKNPTRKGYEFKGWYYKGKKVTKLKQIKGKTNVTLTAKWTKLPKPTLKNVKVSTTPAFSLHNTADVNLTITWKKQANTKYEIKCETKGGVTRYDGYYYKDTILTDENKVSLYIEEGQQYKVTLRAYTKDSTGKKTYSKAKVITGTNQ